MASFWKRVFPSFAALVAWRVHIWHQKTVVILDHLELTLRWELLIFGAVFPVLDKSHFHSPFVVTGGTLATPSLPAPPV